jgi:hypothetical protein
MTRSKDILAKPRSERCQPDPAHLPLTARVYARVAALALLAAVAWPDLASAVKFPAAIPIDCTSTA